MTFDCTTVGHHFQQIETKIANPVFVFCTQCGQLLRYDLDQASLNGLTPASTAGPGVTL